VHCDSGKVLADELSFAGVQAAAYLETDRAHRITNRAGTADRSRRPVEGGKKAVARGVDLTSSVLLQYHANHCALMSLWVNRDRRDLSRPFAHVRDASDCVAKLFWSSERVRLIQYQASMRNVDSRVHSL
jgi:hypothetical protein